MVVLANYKIRTIRKDIIRGLKTRKNKFCKTIYRNIIKQYTGALLQEIGITDTSIEVIQTLLLKFHENDFLITGHAIAVDVLVPEVYRLADLKVADIVLEGLKIENLSVRSSIADILIGLLFQVLFGLSLYRGRAQSQYS
jgi:hypothetical protein